MKIISPFKDYYDSVAQYGIDEGITYYRVTEVINRVDTRDYSKRNEYKMAVNTSNIPVISKIYTGDYYLKGGRYNGFDYFTIGISGKFYNLILSASHGLIRSPEEFFTFYDTRRERYWSDTSECEIVKFFNSTHDSDLFLKYKVPVLMFDNKCLQLNPNLSTLQIQKVLPPYEAFVSIQDYISGVLGVNENPIVQVSDKDMRDAKGFDDWSFKKLPSKRGKVADYRDDKVIKLRELSGCGMVECKKALAPNNDDIDLAYEALRKRAFGVGIIRRG